MEHNKIKRLSFFFFTFFTIIIIGLSISGCYYDNEEELYKYTQTPCDTNLFTYSKDIDPILSTYCYSCHGQNSPTSGIPLQGYSALTTYLNTNKDRFLGSINQTGSYKPMPHGGTKLIECNIKKIEKWIAAGAPNN